MDIVNVILLIVLLVLLPKTWKRRQERGFQAGARLARLEVEMALTRIGRLKGGR